MIVVLLSGCYTAKRATFHVVKAQGSYPAVVAEKCASFYPTKDSISIVEKLVKGKTDTLFEEVIVDCDTVVQTKYRKGRVVTKFVPKYIKHNDTIYKTKTKVVESTAKIKSMQSKLDELTKDNVVVADRLKRANNALKWILGLIGLALVLLFIKMKFKK